MTRRLRCQNCGNVVEWHGDYFRFQKLVQGEPRVMTSFRICEDCFKKFFGGDIIDLMEENENNK